MERFFMRSPANFIRRNLLKTLFEHIKKAHNKSGAPGKVTGYWGNGYYNVRLQYGYKPFRFFTCKNGCVTVKPSWTIAGDRQRKQATSSL
jgi:hypothetical protein